MNEGDPRCRGTSDRVIQALRPHPSPQDQLPAGDETLTLSGLSQKPAAVTLLGTGRALEFRYADGVATVPLPAATRSPLVDVVKVDLR